MDTFINVSRSSDCNLVHEKYTKLTNEIQTLTWGPDKEKVLEMGNSPTHLRYCSWDRHTPR